MGVCLAFWKSSKEGVWLRKGQRGQQDPAAVAGTHGDQAAIVPFEVAETEALCC